jgi:hypothetical protein
MLFSISYVTQGRLAVSEPIRTAVTVVPSSPSSINFWIAESPFFLVLSHREASSQPAAAVASTFPALRTLVARQMSFS